MNTTPLTQHYRLTLDVPADMDFYDAQERVLQNFPDRIGGINIVWTEIVAGYVDPDGVPYGPRVPQK